MFYHAIYPDIWVDVYKTIHTGTFYLDEQKSSIRIEYMGAGDNKISSIIVNKGEGTGEKGGIKLFPESSQRDMIVHW